MPTHVLVVDANTAFATMIQQALTDHGGYAVSVASTAAEAVGLAAQSPVDLAIVDMGLPDVSGADAIRGLRATRPHMAVVAIPVGGDAPDPAEAELDVQGHLTKPFFLPDLAGVVEAALAQPVGGVVRPRPGRPAPAREGEAARAKSPAAGPPAWPGDEDEAARHLARSLRQSQAEAGLVVQVGRLIAHTGRFSQDDFEELASIVRVHWAGGGQPSQNALMRFVRLASTGSEHLLYATAASADLVLALVFPPDTPIGTVRRRAREAVEALAQAPAESPPAAAPPGPQARAKTRPLKSSPSTPEVQTATMPEWTVAAPQASGRATAADSASQLAVDMGLQLPVDESLSGLARTPHALYNLTYAIVWAPKFPKTRLAGDITGNLGEWIRHIALSYDWRVERVEVRPECVVVVVNCPPEIAPERVINTLKRTTSERVFVEFPNIAADHPGGDFWAPGYLLLGAGQMVTPQQINDFLAFTRREQGLRR